MPERLDLRDLVIDAERLMRSALGADVALSVRSCGEPLPVVADRGRLEQLLLNLALNAREALPAGGLVRIDLDAVVVAPGAALAPGRYARLVVSDEGLVRTSDVGDRAVEPFLTTNGSGTASGLGLTTVDGIVRAAGGRLELDSAPGHGTRVLIHLPAADAEPRLT